jgi:subtilisin family serine protease
MEKKKNVIIQMRHSGEIKKSLKASRFSATAVPTLDIAGFSIDETYIPAKIPKRIPRENIEADEVGKLFTYNSQPEVSTYVIRGTVDNNAALNRLIEAVRKDPDYVGVYADVKMSSIETCPDKSVGTYKDVAKLLETTKLQKQGMDGSKVTIAIVDTGIKMDHLLQKGIKAKLDTKNSWSPLDEVVFGPGKYQLDHGTMCAFDACIAAPNCTLLDYALLRTQTQGETVMEGLLSDAITAYSKLLNLITTDNIKLPLVVNNSWGMFNPSWDFPIGDPKNYSANPEHPFNIIVESLDDAGADLLFAAGNCGKKCPDNRCDGVTSKPIYGANSSDSVLCIGGVTTKTKDILGYSSQGPGHLSKNKPDVCTYTHFAGSEVYPADGGTSAACPVAAGVVAAIRSAHPTSDITPPQLRNIIRKTAIDKGNKGFDYKYGYGLINPMGIVKAITA